MNTIFLYIVIFLIIGWVIASGRDKYQWVRLIDILVYGPVCIWLGLNTIQEMWKNIFLIFLGSTTITYNLRNYLGYI